MSGVVVVGTSWGGLAALSELVSCLPLEFSLPICIAQHRSKDSDGLLVKLLQDLTALCVQEGEDKQPLAAGNIYIAPPDYHMLVDREDIVLTVDAPVRFSRPSIDVLFRSAADTFKSSAIGVVLTGANEDGSAGLSWIVARGGRAIVQDPATAESVIMPASAARAVPSATILPLEEIGDALKRMTSSIPLSPSRKAG